MFELYNMLIDAIAIFFSKPSRRPLPFLFLVSKVEPYHAFTISLDFLDRKGNVLPLVTKTKVCQVDIANLIPWVDAVVRDRSSEVALM